MICYECNGRGYVYEYVGPGESEKIKCGACDDARQDTSEAVSTLAREMPGESELQDNIFSA
jgi:hypothetical protein